MKKLVFLLMLLWSSWVWAINTSIDHFTENNNSIQIANLQLQMEKQRLQETRSDLNRLEQDQSQRWNTYVSQGVNPGDIDQASLDIANAKAVVGNIKIDLADALEAVLLTQNELTDLKKHNQVANYSSNFLTDVSDYTRKIASLQNLLNVQNQRIAFLNQANSLATQRLRRLREWREQLLKLQQDQVEQGKQQSINTLEAKLQNEQQKLLENLALLTQKFDTATLHKNNKADDSRRDQMQFQIFTTQEKISINRLQLFLTQLQERIQPLIAMAAEIRDAAILYEKEALANKALDELSGMSSIVNDKINLIRYRKKFAIRQAENNHLLDQLVSQYQNQSKVISNLQAQVRGYRDQVQSILKNQIMIRQTLPGTNLAAWLNLAWQTVQIPKLVWASSQNILIQLVYQFKLLFTWKLYLFVLIITFLLNTWFFLRQTFRRLLRKLEDSSRRFSSQVFTVILNLARKNLGTLFIIAALLSVGLLFDIDMSMWISMVLVFLTYRLAVSVSRLWFVENATDEAGKDVRLYHELKWLYGFGALLTLLTVLSYYLPVSYEVKTLFNKTFMLLLLGVSLLLIRAWSILPDLLTRVFAVRRNYVLQVIRLICWVLPITLLTNAIIGLVGYVDLAAAIGKYQALSLVILAAYMIARGILMDFMELNYEWLIRHFNSGWLWAQAFVKPLDRLLRLALFIATLSFLFHCYGLDQNAIFINRLGAIITRPLINLGGNIISIKLIIEFLIFTLCLYWIAKWSREFAFRWLYSKAKDIGLRTSLSMFTQYLIVIIGVLVALQVFGVDLKGFAVFAAVFVAGVAYALRDLVSSLIGGVVLLIERPFRVGDTITLEPYEGEVVSSGLRSMKIRTWDHQEVIVPNSEIFTKPFVNWTHQDSIVRTVIKIKVNRADNPYQIQEIILNVLNNNSAAVKHPIPEVFMKDISECLIDFEVRYHINLRINTCRNKVRSEILFQIWSAFEKAGIKHPYPHYEIFLESSEKKFREEKMLME